MELFLRDVRSFVGEHRIPIRPLTILVGENSSGKSTILAMLSALTKNGLGLTATISFNEAPYDMGGFDDIRSKTAGGDHSKAGFSIGYTLEKRGVANFHALITSFDNRLGQPALSGIEYENEFGLASIAIDWNRQVGSAKLAASKTAAHMSVEYPIMGNSPLVAYMPVLFLLHSGTQDPDFPGNEADARELWQILAPGLDRLEPSLSLAPVRSRARRTYDGLGNDFRPEGEHVPLLLAQMLANRSNGSATRVVSALEEFGRESGLFRSLSVRQLGEGAADPFQVIVSADGPPANLSDVGYGVSQSIPVVVQSVLLSPGQRLLMQQPEVHLHPRAQAALGTLFARLVGTQSKQMVVETHSDYIVDRVRRAVADGIISKEAVGILFLEKREGRTTVHQIELDDLGNITNAPASYRQFFLDEEIALLSRG